MKKAVYKSSPIKKEVKAGKPAVSVEYEKDGKTFDKLMEEILYQFILNDTINY